jgi:hypothetical protein
MPEPFWPEPFWPDPFWPDPFWDNALGAMSSATAARA